MTYDIRFAIRMITSRAWFSLAIVVTLAFGIGVNTTVFTLVNAVLFKPVPLPNGARLAVVNSSRLGRANDRGNVSYPDFIDFKKSNKSFEALEGSIGGQAIVADAGNPPAQYRMAHISAGLFEAVHTPPLLGRAFTSADDRPGAESKVVISHAMWQNRYGSDPKILGKPIRLNGQITTIIGVMPEGFRFPTGQDLWAPLIPTEALEKRSTRDLTLYGVLREGVSFEAAGADFAVIAKQLADSYPDSNKDIGARVLTFHQAFNGGEIRVIFLLMLGAVGCVLLIACANVANMMLSRSLARRRELTVRAALGASRWQLIRQLLVESVLLSVLGGVVGLGLARVGVHYFDLATAPRRPYWIGFEMDWVAFGYFAAVSIMSGLVVGLMPALRSSRIDLADGLREGTRGVGGPGTGRVAGVLVALQFALTVILLSAAGLLGRSFFEAQALNPFVPEREIFTARVNLPEGTGQPYAERDARVRFYDGLLRQMAAIPEVSEVAISSNVPGGGSPGGQVEIEGQALPADKKLAPRAAFVVASPGYLSLIQLAIQSGRGFDALDGEPGREVAIASADFANRHWPGQQALGKRFRYVDRPEPGPWIRIVGITGNMVQNQQRTDDQALLYIPYRQMGWGGMALLLRTRSGAAANLARPAQTVVQSLDQDLPLFEMSTLNDTLSQQRWFLPVFGTVFGSFALIGLLIAAVGIYAVGAHAAARRTREIGIRMALGATANDILSSMLTGGVLSLGSGLILGLAGAVATAGFLEGILVKVSPRDPLVFIAVGGLLMMTGLCACWLPARRAARMDPMAALRDE